jgi:hypothetical protein
MDIDEELISGKNVVDPDTYQNKVLIASVIGKYIAISRT